MKKYGKLTLIPAPLAPDLPLEPVALSILSHFSSQAEERGVFVFEDAKPARRFWLKQGLPRETIESFHYLNEHNAKDKTLELLEFLKKDYQIFLMSDGGLPSFCDPGTDLVNLCHKNKIQVSMTPHSNSISQALALSGYPLNHFEFFGFLPKDQEERDKLWKTLISKKHVKVIMDTPYRLRRVLEEARRFQVKEVFLAMDLNAPTEIVRRDSPDSFLADQSLDKKEFVLVF